MGGTPSKGTKKDLRLKENQAEKNRRKGIIPTNVPQARQVPPISVLRNK